jgi:hypothetical protein
MMLPRNPTMSEADALMWVAGNAVAKIPDELLEAFRDYLARVDSDLVRNFLGDIAWAMPGRQLAANELPCLAHLARAAELAGPAHRVVHIRGMVDDLAALSLHEGTIAHAPIGPAGQRNVDLFRHMMVVGIDHIGPENEKSGRNGIVRKMAARAEQFDPAARQPSPCWRSTCGGADHWRRARP